MKPIKRSGATVAGSTPPPPLTRGGLRTRLQELAHETLGSGGALIPGDMAPLILDMLPNRPSLFGQGFAATTTIPAQQPANASNVYLEGFATPGSIAADMKMATEVVLAKQKLAAVVPVNPLLLSPRVIQGLKDDVERCKVDLAAKTRTQRFTVAKIKGVPVMEPCDVCGKDTAARRHGVPRHMICDERFSAKELVDTIRGVQHFLDQK